MDGVTEKPSISRRDFIKWLGAIGAGAALGRILTTEREATSFPASSAQKTAVALEKTPDAFEGELRKLPEEILLNTFKIIERDPNHAFGTAFAFLQRQIKSENSTKCITFFLTASHVVSAHSANLELTQPHLKEYGLDKSFYFSDDPHSNAKTEFYVYPGVSDMAVIMEIRNTPLFPDDFSVPIGTESLPEDSEIVTLGYPVFDDSKIGERGFVSSGIVKEYDKESGVYNIRAVSDGGISGSAWWDIQRKCIVGLTTAGNKKNFTTITPITRESLFRIFDKRDKESSYSSVGDTLWKKHKIDVDVEIKPFLRLV